MPTIQLRTAIPGPKSRELMRRREARRAARRFPRDADFRRSRRRRGSRRRRRQPLPRFRRGHWRAERRAIVRPGRGRCCASSSTRFIHTCFSVAPYEKYIALAEKLNALTPGDFAKKTLLVNSGAEAIENAVKIARAYTRRPAIICFRRCVPRPHHAGHVVDQQDASV